MTSHTPGIHPPTPTVTDLLRWSDIVEFAVDELDRMRIGQQRTLLHCNLEVPSHGDVLPNGFRFPSTHLTDMERAVFYAVVSQYSGPDLTTCHAFNFLTALAAQESQPRITSKLLRKWRGNLILRDRLTEQDVNALPLDAFFDRLYPNSSEGESDATRSADNGDATLSSPDAPLAAQIDHGIPRDPSGGGAVDSGRGMDESGGEYDMNGSSQLHSHQFGGVGASMPEVPVWNRLTRQLKFRGKVIRDYKKKMAPIQEYILDELQAKNWPDALKLERGSRSLKDVIAAFNKSVTPDTIRLGKDGTATGVSWEVVDNLP